MSEDAPSMPSPVELEQALNASVADQSSAEKNNRLHDVLMKSFVYLEVPDSVAGEFKANGYKFKDDKPFFVALKLPGAEYNSVLIFTSFSESKKTPHPTQYSVAVSGRQAFEFARTNGVGVILNAYSKPTIAWAPDLVADYLK